MRTVLITGSSSGIGQQLALDYANKGWVVIACGRNELALQTLAKQTTATIKPLAFDISEREQVLEAANSIQVDIDLLILNAGTCEYMDDLPHFDSQLFERVIRINLLGNAYCLEAFLPKLSNSDAQLAIVSSSASFLPFTRAQAYGSSKAALNYLTRSLAVDLEPNIKVSLINPGFVETPLTDKNDFAMPMRISVEQASKAIIQGLEKGKAHIAMPWFFTTLLGWMGSLPYSIQHFIAKRMKA